MRLSMMLPVSSHLPASSVATQEQLFMHFAALKLNQHTSSEIKKHPSAKVPWTKN
jgi:hypothetical protein